MATTVSVDDGAAAIAEAHAPALPSEEKMIPPRYDSDRTPSSSIVSHEPTEEELQTLRRVAGSVPFNAYTVAFVELCERFSWYGTTTLFSNFVLWDLPPGSTTGAGKKGKSGALGQGQKTAYAISQYNKFWAYVTPILGAYLADTYWGRYKTIMASIACAMVGHILLVVSAAPSVIVHAKTAFGVFCAAITIMGLGTGGFKSNISPLIAEQYTVTKKQVITLDSGERVIMDPNLTVSRIYMYFYMMINIGSLIGQITMVFAEKWVGFWLAFLLPTFMFSFCPAIMVWGRTRYKRTPPTGSVMATFFKFVGFAMKGRWSINPVTLVKNINDGTFWERSKPSQVPDEQKPYWMVFDDAWVDELKRALSACKVFCFYPIYWLAYGQIDNNLTAQAALMNTHGLPNEFLNNINPLTLIIFIPIFDILIYPSLRKKGIVFTPLKKITSGFFMGVLAMLWAAILQWKIYTHHPCGYYPTSTKDCREKIADISVWWQVGPYLLIGISEIFASITGLEYAFSKAPKNMRSIVMSMFLLMNAFSTAIGYGMVDLVADPLLIWNYGVAAILAFVAGIAFWLCFRHLDAQEDALNALQASTYLGKDVSDNRANEEEPHRIVNVNADEKK